MEGGKGDPSLWSLGPERQQVQLKRKHGKEPGYTARRGWGDRRIVQDLVGQV